MCSNACDCTTQVPSAKLAGEDGELLLCKKCKLAKPFIIMEKVHVHCKECFVESCRKKFRSTLGRSKLLSHGDRVLVAYSGGQSSTMLLDLIQHSLHCDQHRQLKFLPIILYVDCGILLNESPSYRANRVNAILKEASQTYAPWRFIWTTIEVAFDVSADDDEPVICSEFSPCHPSDESHILFCNKNKRDQFLTRLTDDHREMTSKLNFIQKSLNDSIQSVSQYVFSTNSKNPGQGSAERLGSDYIFVGSTSSQLATNLMIDVIIGQGSELRSCVGFSDCRAKVTTLRPLREFSKKEVVFYLLARKLTFHTKKSMSTFSGRKSSVQRVTEDFLNQLYVEYPATYNTLLRTGDKMRN